MPSLFRYFVVVGGVLTGLLLLVNAWLAPEPVATPAMAAAAPIVVRHDPRASIIERWRTEQAARKAAERGEPPVPALAAAAEAVAPVSEPSPTQPGPPQIVAPAALATAPAEGDPRAEARKAEQIRAARAHKARIARERADRQRQEQAASRQQDQFFYGGLRPAYAAAPTPGPFGSGRTW